MATLVKHRNLFSIQFYDKDRIPARKKIALRTSDKRLALRLKRKLEAAYLELRFDPWRDDPRTLERKEGGAIAVSEALARFLASKQQSGRAANTIRAYRDAIGLWTRVIGAQTPLKAIHVRDVAGFVHDPQVSPTTRAFRHRHLRAFFRWLHQHKLLNRNLLEGVDAPRKAETEPKAVSLQEVDAICQALEDIYSERLRSGGCRAGEIIWRVPMFRFAFFTGMRMSELSRLRWWHIDLDSKSVMIVLQKNRKVQAVPLVDPAMEVLCEIREGELESFVFASPKQPVDRSTRQFVNGAGRAFKEARLRAGIHRRITPHSLRHGFCTALANAGKSAIVIREAARHADITTSMRYVALANQTLRAELSDVFTGSPKDPLGTHLEPEGFSRAQL